LTSFEGGFFSAAVAAILQTTVRQLLLSTNVAELLRLSHFVFEISTSLNTTGTTADSKVGHAWLLLLTVTI
jgi:hypothetical protein